MSVTIVITATTYYHREDLAVTITELRLTHCISMTVIISYECCYCYYSYDLTELIVITATA